LSISKFETVPFLRSFAVQIDVRDGTIATIFRYCRRACDGSRSSALLNSVHELVSDQPAAGIGLGSVLAGGERDVAADRVSPRVERARRFGCSTRRMYSHMTEVMTET
jgi:hypothetical protein